MTDATPTPPQPSTGARRATRFARLPEALIFDPAVPHQAIRLWAAVNRLTAGGNAYGGSWGDLGAELGWSRDSAKRAAHTLAAAGWATIASSAGVPGVLVVHEHQGEQLVPDTAAGAANPGQMCPDPEEQPGADVPHPPGQIRPDPGADSPRPPLRKERARVERERVERKAASRTPDPEPDDGSSPAATPPLVQLLGEALAADGITVRTVRRAEQATDVERLVQVHGVPALVRHARAQYRPDNPAASMAAFLDGWADLPPPRPRRAPERPPAPPVERVATEDRAPETVAELARVRAALRGRRSAQ